MGGRSVADVRLHHQELLEKRRKYSSGAVGTYPYRHARHAFIMNDSMRRQVRQPVTRTELDAGATSSNPQVQRVTKDIAHMSKIQRAGTKRSSRQLAGRAALVSLLALNCASCFNLSAINDIKNRYAKRDQEHKQRLVQAMRRQLPATKMPSNMTQINDNVAEANDRSVLDASVHFWWVDTIGKEYAVLDRDYLMKDQTSLEMLSLNVPTVSTDKGMNVSGVRPEHVHSQRQASGASQVDRPNNATSGNNEGDRPDRALFTLQASASREQSQPPPVPIEYGSPVTPGASQAPGSGGRLLSLRRK